MAGSNFPVWPAKTLFRFLLNPKTEIKNKEISIGNRRSCKEEQSQTKEVIHVPNKILVADDDQIILSTIQTGLESEGYRILTAQDGETAVRIGCANKPDLAVLDIRMPGNMA